MSWKVSATIQSTGLPLLLKRAWKNDAIVFSDEELVLAAFIAVLVKARRCASLVCDSGRTLLYRTAKLIDESGLIGFNMPFCAIYESRIQSTHQLHEWQFRGCTVLVVRGHQSRLPDLR